MSTEPKDDHVEGQQSTKLQGLRSKPPPNPKGRRRSWRASDVVKRRRGSVEDASANEAEQRASHLSELEPDAPDILDQLASVAPRWGERIPTPVVSDAEVASHPAANFYFHAPSPRKKVRPGSPLPPPMLTVTPPASQNGAKDGNGLGAENAAGRGDPGEVAAEAEAEDQVMHLHPLTCAEAGVGGATSADVVEGELVLDSLDLDVLPNGSLTCAWLTLMENALGRPVRVPVMVAKGMRPGPVLGFSAAIHGDELQGIPVLHDTFRQVLVPHLAELSGIVVACLCANPYGFQMHQREYLDGVDLNRLFPGNPNGAISQQFVHAFMSKFVRKTTHYVDLHTASFGHVNTLYVRADMTDDTCATMARLQTPSIIVHNAGGDSTLRGSAMKEGIKAITVEIGNPSAFQPVLIERTCSGLVNILHHLTMLPTSVKRTPSTPDDLTPDTNEQPIVCNRSYWVYTDRGGLLTVFPREGDEVRRGEVIASVVDIFGVVRREYTAPEDGFIVGKTTNPSAHQGDRILHIGIPKDVNEPFT